MSHPDNIYQARKGKTGFIQLLKHIFRYVKPYRWLVIVTLVLTMISSLLAQVNAVVLDRPVVAHQRDIVG